MADITMPQLGETVTEGTITRWAKKVGDRVDEDEVLFEVSTDKVDSEVPSPAAGYLAEILVQEGETVDVGTKLAVIADAPPDGQGDEGGRAEPGPADEAEAEQEGTARADEAEQEVTARAGEAGEMEESDEAAETDEADQADEAEQEATARAGEEAAPEDSGGGGGGGGGGADGDGAGGARAPAGEGGGPVPAERSRRQEEPAAPASGRGPRPPDARPPARPGGGDGTLLSPVVRRLVAEHGLDPQQIRGTGAGGRITRADVLALIDARGGAGTEAEPAGDGDAAPAQRGGPGAPARGERDEVVPFSNIRRRTAEHMRRSLDTSAHTLVVIEVDYANVDEVRLPARDRFKAEEGVGLSYLPFIARAVVDAIREFPRVNASVGDDELVVHHDVNLGIAVDLSFEGLIVPVVHGADGKRLRLLAREIAGLAARARGKKLGADDIAGGTFTITNAGAYGTLLTAPIINQPQVAILSTDGVKPRPVAVPLPGGVHAVAVHPVGNLALSFDHRAFDGAYASAFLARVREVMETREWDQELA